MKQDNEFDELARRKLEERTFPYDEANWLEVQRALEAERRRRRGMYWSLAAGLLLLVGVGTWWRAANSSADPAPAEVANTATTPEVTVAPAEQATQATTNAPEPMATPPPATTERPATVQQPRVTSNAAPVEQKNTKPASRKRTSSSSPRTQTANTPAAANAGMQFPASSSGEPEPPPVKPTPLTIANTATTEPSGGTITPVDTATPGPEPDPILVVSTVTPQDTAPITNTGVPDPVVATTTTPKDSTLATASTPQDSAVTPPALPPSTPILPPKPWEITALGGLLTSTSTYTGGTSAIWGESLTGERSTGFGLEVMHLDRHFGYGTGLHYTSYSEHISSPDKYADVTSYQDAFFLTAVDTTVLAVTDTIFQQGQYYYVTTPITTTIFVLDQTVDTVITNMRVQQAKEHVNSLSYLEVPLLLDAHTGKGHWSFGVRGGPTIGLLTGKRGSLPDNVLDGFVDYADQSFRSYALGYVARAYMRYGFCSAWSVGIEPTIRGHFTDAYENYGLTRRSSGFGAMLSLSYKLR
ncbi:MAG: hypothetical protein IT229_07685 [Flavobacteriales bacterium]|nr:hypothetical protein [Flavobacteriales bacterium]